jgi:hypothetical protein
MLLLVSLVVFVSSLGEDEPRSCLEVEVVKHEDNKDLSLSPN